MALIARFPRLASSVGLVLVTAGGLGGLGWFWWSACCRPEVSFLPHRRPAEWIVYPSAPDLVLRPRLEMSTVFKRSFVLEKVPSSASLSIAGFHSYSLSINSAAPERAARLGQTWKEPDAWEVAKQLRVGENLVAVTVLNCSGPPALWLSLEAGGFRLASDETWQSSYAGASWRAARCAAKPKLVPAGNLIAAGERPWSSFLARWPTLLLFAALSTGACWLISKRRGQSRRTQSGNPESEGRGLHSAVFRWEILPAVGLAVLWIALFTNNLGVLPAKTGFDAGGHLEYISYLQEHKALPLAGQGWEMFQPPLYYLFSAALLRLVSLSISQASGVMAVRVMGLGIGIAHFVLVASALRMLFPGQRAKKLWGLMLAGCLPALLYVSHYVSNEGLAAVLVSACVLVCLCILKQESAGYYLYATLGLGLGLALLTKVTALLAVPPILGALFWKEIGNKNGSSWTWSGKILLVVGLSALVCGWHYARAWALFGSPFIGGWEPNGRVGWWQDEGYQTSAYYLRFGESLRHPWFGGAKGFADGLFSTLWGDGLFGGLTDPRSRPPWNYDLMATGYWLALVPTVALVVGGFLALRAFIRQPSAEWFLLLGLGFAIMAALVQVSLTAPYHCMVKAFYGLSAMIPLCALGALGLEALTGRLRTISGMFCGIIFGVWMLNAYASFWIVRSAAPTSVARACELFNEGRLSEAIPILKSQLKREPKDRNSRCLLVPLLILAGDVAAAATHAESLARDHPNAGESELAMAMVRGSQQRSGEAIEHARRATVMVPGWGFAHQQLVMLLSGQKRYVECIRSAREGLSVAPFDAEIRWRLGSALLSVGQDAEANVQLQFGCGLEPDRAQAECKWAEILSSHRETAQAVAHYQEALRLNSALPNALNNLAWIRAVSSEAKFRDGAEAVNLAERACRASEYQDPLIMGTLAAAYAEAGRFEEAVATATKARALALAGGMEDLAEKNRQLIQRFAAREPYRETSPDETRN